MFSFLESPKTIQFSEGTSMTPNQIGMAFNWSFMHKYRTVHWLRVSQRSTREALWLTPDFWGLVNLGLFYSLGTMGTVPRDCMLFRGLYNFEVKKYIILSATGK